MSDSSAGFRYRLGVDVGVASLGIALIRTDDVSQKSGSSSIISGSVRTYEIPEGAEDLSLIHI